MQRLLMAVPTVLAVLVGIFLIAPVLIVVPMSFSTAISFEFPPPGYSLGYYRAYFADENSLVPTANSFGIAVATTIVTMAIAVPAAFGYVRYRFRGKSLVNLLIMSPLIVPHVVSALGYYGYLSLGQLVGTHVGVILAHTALAVPVTFLVICATLKGYDRNLERAAMISGAGPLRTFFTSPCRCCGRACSSACSSPSLPPSTKRWWRSSSGGGTPRPCPRRCSRASASNPIRSSPWSRRFSQRES